jgi:hypothetical protein
MPGRTKGKVKHIDRLREEHASRNHPRRDQRAHLTGHLIWAVRTYHTHKHTRPRAICFQDDLLQSLTAYATENAAVGSAPGRHIHSDLFVPDEPTARVVLEGHWTQNVAPS